MESRQISRPAQDKQRMYEERQEGEFHLAGFDLPAEVFWRSANHHAADKHADDDVQEHVDQTHANPAKKSRSATMPASGMRPVSGLKLSVHAVDRTVACGGRERSPQRTGGGTEPEFLSLEVPVA